MMCGSSVGGPANTGVAPRIRDATAAAAQVRADPAIRVVAAKVEVRVNFMAISFT